MPAGFGRAGARICRSKREVEIEVSMKSDTETGVSLLHLI